MSNIQDEQLTWREEISEPKATLKIADKEVVFGTLLDEGEKKSHPDFGSSVAFKFKKDKSEEELIWYVNSRNFDLLGQIKALGKTTNLKVKITRHGTTKSNTRYIIEKVN